MGLMTGFKAMRAYKLHSEGKLDEARALYEQAVSEGLKEPRYLLSYSVLLIRNGEYQKARELLVKSQKAPGITPEQKTQLFMNYAACMYKLGEIDKGIAILERQHAKQPSGIVYQTLGYLYVEKLAGWADNPAPAVQESEAEEEAAGQENAQSPEDQQEAQLSPEEQREQLLCRAKAFCEEACEYDDEDAICLDNLGQLYYRVLGDREKAKPYFEKAIAVRPGQIDTLWFLSRYDLEAGDQDACIRKLEKLLEGKFSVLNYATREMAEAELQRLRQSSGTM